MISQTNLCTECREPCKGITCSMKCRKRRERRQREARTAHAVVMHELSKIRVSLKRRENVTKLADDLKRLKGEINDLLLLAGDADAMNKHLMLTDISRKRSVTGHGHT